MKKSKIISLFKIIFISFIILYIYIVNEKSIYKTNYEIGNNTIYGTIIDIKISDKTEMIIKAKDKIKIVSYEVLDYKMVY